VAKKSKAKATAPNSPVIQNRKAFHDYAIEDRYEAGLVLRGREVKSLREGQANIRQAYAVVREGEAWLMNMHIAPYSRASTHEDVDPERSRKLLLHSEEIERLAAKTQQLGYTLVPLRVYFKEGYAKVELGLARGKRKHDRRQEIAERDARLQMDRARRRREVGA
jgi:SsrA-binding protein